MLNNILKNKNIIFIIGIIIIIIITTLLSNTKLNDNNVTGTISNPDGEKFKSEYENLNETITEDGKNYPEVKIPINNIIKYSDISEILNIFSNNEDAVIYLGTPDCLYCRSAIQVLCDTASNTELDTIYYLNIKDDDSRYNELLELLGAKFTTNGGKEIYIPLVLFVTNGDIVSHNKGTLFSQEDPYKELDNSQIEGLSTIYYHGIKDVLENRNK